MSELHERLRDHVIICGYGVKGRAIVTELVAHGHAPRDIVVIDPDEAAVALAVKDGVVALRGDASSESLLQAAAVTKAGYVLAAPDRDDACVLICLTVRSLAPKVQLVAAAREEENVKLLYSAGANLVIAPSVSGGRLMASAVSQSAVPYFLEDVIAFGQDLRASEREVKPGEAGMLAGDLPDLSQALVLGVARGKERVAFPQVDTLPLKQGDIIVYLVGNNS